VGIVGYFQVVKPEIDNRTVETSAPTPIASQETDLAFSYPSGVDSLLMIEPPISSTSPSGLKKVYLLADYQEYIEYSNEGSVGTPPPTISIFALSYASTTDGGDAEGAGRVSKLQTWAAQNPQFTSWTAKNSEAEVVEVDGATAIRYTAAGTYQQEVYVVLYVGDMYVFAGQFEEEGGVMQTRFADLVSSVIFN